MLLALAMVLTLAAFPAFAEDPAKITGITAQVKITLADGTDPGYSGSNSPDRMLDGNTTATYFQSGKAFYNSTKLDVFFDLGDYYTLSTMEYYGGSLFINNGSVFATNKGLDAADSDWVEIGGFTTNSAGYPSYLTATANFTDTTAYRYVKVRANSYNTTGSQIALREFIFTGVKGEAPEVGDEPETPKEPVQIAIADGISNYAQSDSGHTVKQTYDGNLTGSYFQTSAAINDAENPDFYFVYDLGKAYNLTHFTYYGGSCYFKAATIYGSNTGMDATDWTELATVSGSLNWTTYIVMDTDLNVEGNFRYIKVQSTAFNKADKPPVREIIFTGVEGEPTIPERAPATYTVNYVDAEGNSIKAAKNGTGKVGDYVTETAPAIDGYIIEEDEKSITLIDGTNEITFTYTKLTNSMPRPVKPINGKGVSGSKGATIGANIANSYDGTLDAAVSVNTNNYDKSTGDIFTLEYEFDQKYTFSTITMYWSSNRFVGGTVYVSNDGVNWGSPVFSGTMPYVVDGNYRVVTITLPEYTTGKYVKLVADEIVSNGWPSFKEIEFVATIPEAEVVTPKGGSIRIASEQYTAGLRFAATVDKALAGIEGNYTYSDSADVKFGMFLLPTEKLGTSATLVDYIKADGESVLDIPAKKIYEQDTDTVTYTAVLTEIPSKDYATDVVAVPYMLVGDEYTYFDEITRSFKGVAKAARESTYSDTEIKNQKDDKEKNKMLDIAYYLDAIIAGKEPETVPAVTASTPTWTTDFNGTLGSTWYKCPEGNRQDGSYWEDDMTSFDSDGNLVLSAQWDSSKSTLLTGAVRTMTKNYSTKYSAGYGYYEARVKFPNDHKGAWGAFWQMAGNVTSTSNGASDGVEIDFIESIGNDSGKCQSALHWDGYGDAHKSTDATYLAHNIYDGDWHTIGCERTANGYKFYIDGRLMWTVGTEEVAACSNKGYLKLSVEAAIWAAGASDATTYASIMSNLYANKTDIMVIDYVKVWEY